MKEEGESESKVPERIRLFRIPVRAAIHSSEVSTTFEMSSFETWSAGVADPHPVSFEPIPTTLQFLINVKTFPATSNSFFIPLTKNVHQWVNPSDSWINTSSNIAKQWGTKIVPSAATFMSKLGRSPSTIIEITSYHLDNSIHDSGLFWWHAVTIASWGIFTPSLEYQSIEASEQW